jgi:hypothetical protein
MSLRHANMISYYRGSVIEVYPSVEPVTLSEVKALLVIDGSGDDALLTDMIEESREFIEHIAGLAMITQQWRLSLDRWPMTPSPWWDGVQQMAISELTGQNASLQIPVWPLQTVNVVTVFDSAGTGASVTIADVFDVDTYQHPGRLSLKYGATWPIALRDTNAIQIEYTAGYGATAADVPGPLKRAIKTIVGYMYSHRGDGCDSGDAYTESGAAAIVGRYKVVRI